MNFNTNDSLNRSLNERIDSTYRTEHWCNSNGLRVQQTTSRNIQTPSHVQEFHFH